MNDIRDMEKQAAAARELNRKAALAMPSLSHLECSKCGERGDVNQELAEKYLKDGWPEHCEQTMQLITKAQVEIIEGDAAEMRIGTEGGQVVILFPKAITRVAMNADQAYAFAKILFKRAKKLTRSRLILPGDQH